MKRMVQRSPGARNISGRAILGGSATPRTARHPGNATGTIGLYNKLGEWAPDAALRQRILADNPARLFGFT